MFKQDDRLRKYVTFDGIKKDSYLRSSELESHRRMNLMNIKDEACQEPYKPRHLLDVTVANTSYVFDIDQ